MSKAFQEMDPEKILALIEGQPNILAGEVEKERAFLEHSCCPVCGAYGCESFTNPRRPFTPGVPLSNKLLRCPQCKTEFEPDTRLVTRASPLPIRIG